MIKPAGVFYWYRTPRGLACAAELADLGLKQNGLPRTDVIAKHYIDDDEWELAKLPNGLDLLAEKYPAPYYNPLED